MQTASAPTLAGQRFLNSLNNGVLPASANNMSNLTCLEQSALNNIQQQVDQMLNNMLNRIASECELLYHNVGNLLATLEFRAGVGWGGERKGIAQSRSAL